MPSSSYPQFPPIGTRLEQVECFNEDTREQFWASEIVTLRTGFDGRLTWGIVECDHHHWSRRTAEKCLRARVHHLGGVRLITAEDDVKEALAKYRDKVG